ncbi:MAG: glycoside hydrolase TIM-barrel-like domain-containing protein, partial [Paracoccaceae bacterium]
ALATTPVHFEHGPGVNVSANVNTPGGKTDFANSVEDLRAELDSINSVSMVVSWFGDDLRCDRCMLEPKVEQADFDGVEMPWTVSGLGRGDGRIVSRDADGRSVFGGTQSDQSVIEAIREIRAGGQEVMFYPFILMDILAGNGRSDPWTGGADQPNIPWRGRITLSQAPGQAGSPDLTASAASEVAAFFGAAAVGDFVVGTDRVGYSGPAEWSYRRFILHYAHLCALAGGVESFCIGSEMRSLSQIRDASGGFPAVDALISLAADVRTILGPDVRIGYAADWSEYFGYRPEDGSGDVLFHLDPLWADPNIDFIGIDNYMPLSDWRDGADHAEAAAGSIYALEYLKANVAGGEGYDWYYASETARDFQIRSTIEDTAHGEDWVFRYKDIRGWWENAHHDRIGGVRQSSPTAWIPESKPVWFTEYGCAAMDKATNQPNAFVDEKSSESRIPRYSNGLRDDVMQAQYLRAVHDYWRDPANNPVSGVFGAPMVDMEHAHVWAWDARPWPAFPARLDLWSDGVNYARGHWLNGRLGAQSLADVIREICELSGVRDIDTSGLHGSLRGYVIGDVGSARSAIQPLMLVFSVDAAEEDGLLRFANRHARPLREIGPDDLVWTGEEPGSREAQRQPEAETAGMVRISHIGADGSYEVGAAEAVFADEGAIGVSSSEFPIVLSRGEAQAVAERWLAESRVARESVALALPPSLIDLAAGDVVDLSGTGGDGLYRIDRIEDAGARRIEAVRVDGAVYAPADQIEDMGTVADFVAPVPVFPLFLDLPLMSGAEVPHAPHLAITATPWPGSVALYAAPQDAGYVLNDLISRGSVIGVTKTALFAAKPGRWDRGPGVDVGVFGGTLSSAAPDAVLNGANLAAIGSGTDDVWELFQFADATLTGADSYHLSTLLRGQAGSGAAMPASWPVGSLVVMLDGAPGQIDLPLAMRNLARHYRIGPAMRDLSDASYVHEVRAFQGIGLRPYAPCHLRAVAQLGGDTAFSWIRRTRIGGDDWEAPDVPLGETFEAYLVRVHHGGAVVREVQTAAPLWTYGAADMVTDGVSVPYALEVAQISEVFGPGSFARIDIDE